MKSQEAVEISPEEMNGNGKMKAAENENRNPAQPLGEG
jgi:hypothetical protein